MNMELNEPKDTKVSEAIAKILDATPGQMLQMTVVSIFAGASIYAFGGSELLTGAIIAFLLQLLKLAASGKTFGGTKVTFLATIGMVIALIVAGIKIAQDRNPCKAILEQSEVAPANVDNHEILAIISDFQYESPENQIGVAMNEAVYRAAQQVMTENPDIKITVTKSPTLISNETQAKKQAECLNATITIWGSNVQGSTRFSFSITNRWSNYRKNKTELNALDIIAIQKSDQLKLDDLVEEGNDSSFVLNLTIAQLYFYSRDWKNEVKYLTLAIDEKQSLSLQSPALAIALARRGEAYSMLEEYDLALQDMTSAINAQPMLSDTNLASVYISKSIFSWILGERVQAKLDIKAAITLNTEFSGEGYFVLGSFFFIENDFSSAIENYNKAYSLGYSRTELYIFTGAAYEFQGQINKAETIYKEALVLDQSNAFLLWRFGIIQHKQGNFSGAVSTFNKVIEISPDFNYVYLDRGESYQKMHAYDKAVADYNHAIVLEPNYAPGYYIRGDMYRELSMFEKAIADYTQGISLQRNADYVFLRATTYLAIGQYQSTLDDIDKLLKSGEVDQVNALLLQGASHIGLGNYTSAYADFDMLITIAPQSEATFYVGRAYASSGLGDYDMSVKDLDQAIALDPSNPAHYRDRGDAYTLLGKTDLAQADYEKAKELGYVPGN